MNHRRLLKSWMLVLILLLVFSSNRVVGATGPYTDSWQEPVDAIVYNPCTGEEIWLTGSIHILYHDNLTPSGQLHWETRTNYHQVTGVGLTSGLTYVGTGVDQGGGSTIVETSSNPYHYEASSQNTMSLVGKGRTANYKVFMNFHLTVTPGFEWTADFTNFRIACK